MHFEPYWPGTRVVVMVERKGRWWFSFEQVYSAAPAQPQLDKTDGLDALRREGLFDLADLQGSAPTLSCAELTNANP